ncbi:MAG: ClpXP protease specificity-enhancing factor [Gammaproteobacteria bacterium]|jgi:stringent starvation protein B
MTPNRPYLLRGLYDWICDNHLTPYLLVDATGDDLSIPFEFVEDGKIVLNISPSAVRDLDLSNDYINFKARFSGQSMNVYFPANAVLAIYAKENGRGMIFQEEEHELANKNEAAAPAPIEDNKESEKTKTSHLRVVK